LIVCGLHPRNGPSRSTTSLAGIGDFSQITRITSHSASDMFGVLGIVYICNLLQL
jgi:hypothetical protein